MSVQILPAPEALARLAIPLGQAGGFSTVIDARSEDEFAHDHLPGAVNWPSLDKAPVPSTHPTLPAKREG